MVQKALGIATFMVLLAAATGCGGFSQEKAEARCEQERYAKSQCVTDTAFDACVACYKECGDGCDARATCPEEYTCNADSEEPAEETAGQ
jgi:hypothetical protein